MAQNIENNDDVSEDRPKRRKKSAIIISHHLFTNDRLLEDAGSENQTILKSRLEWLLMNINFTIGLGPLWRFPTVAYRGTGGAFVVAYTLTFFLIGYPLALLELSLGQCTRRKITAVFKLCTAMEGLSICMGLYAFLLPIYYNVIFAYAIYYIYNAFARELPWTKCDGLSTFPGYVCIAKKEIKAGNVSFVSAQELFWHFKVLRGGSQPGQVFSDLNEPLVVCLALSWLLIGILLINKIRKYIITIEYFLVPLAMFILFLVYILKVSLNDGSRGISPVRELWEFFIPSIEIFKNVEIWREATQQVFFSLGVASGSLITLGSLTHFRNPILFDSAAVCLINFMFSLFSGVTIYYAAATLAQYVGISSAVVQRVNLFGAGFFFIASSKILGELPLPQFWAATFYFLLICFGSRVVLGYIDTTVSVLRGFFPLNRREKFNAEIASALVLIVSFLLGLLLVMKGDSLVLIVLDNYGGATVLPLLAAIECCGVSWIYGVVRFSGDVEFILKYKPNSILRLIWLIIPAYLLLLVAASWIQVWVIYPRNSIAPGLYVLLGWLLVLLIFLPLLIRFIVNFVQLYKRKRLKEIFKSRDDAGPDDLELRYRDENFHDATSIFIPL